jgi:outer membrane lipoprotein-sorting protein
MLKKLTFGILAAAIAIAPGAAFAGQSQSNVQVTNQEGAAINGSTNAQSSTSTNRQQQIQNAQKKAGGYRGSYYKPGYRRNNNTNQSQGSVQRTGQSGAAIDGSVNAQDSATRNNQTQSVRNR